MLITNFQFDANFFEYEYIGKSTLKGVLNPNFRPFSFELRKSYIF